MPSGQSGFIPECSSTVLSTTPAILPISRAFSELFVQSAHANTQTILMGNDTSQTIELLAGEYMIFPLSSSAKLYFKTAAGAATLNWMTRE